MIVAILLYVVVVFYYFYYCLTAFSKLYQMGCNAESAVCAEVIAKHKAAALRFLWRTCGLLLLLSPVWFNGLLAVFAIPMYALTAYILYKLKDEWKRCKLDRRVLYASIMASALASVIVGNIIRSITL